MNSSRWEKVVYLIIFILLAMSTIAGIYVQVAKYLTYPKGVATYIQPIEPFRYPLIILCPDNKMPKNVTDTHLLERALLLPSKISDEAVSRVSAWSDDKLQAESAKMSDSSRVIEEIAGSCESLVGKCSLGEEDHPCCQQSWPLLTKLGVCWALEAEKPLRSQSKPLPALKISLKQNVQLGVADHNVFYLENPLKLREQMVEIRLEAFRYQKLATSYGNNWYEPKVAGPFDNRTIFKNKFTEEAAKYALREDVCGCQFSHFSNHTDRNECEAKEKLDCAGPIFKKYESGELEDIERYDRTDEITFKLTPIGYGPPSPGFKAGIELKYYSNYMTVMQEFAQMDCQTLVWMIGTIFAIHASVLVIVWAFVESCKACIKCCRDKAGAIHGVM